MSDSLTSYGVDLPVYQIFAHPTIAELAESVSADSDFGVDTAQELELDDLSDNELDALLRAAPAQPPPRRPDEPGT